MQEITFFVIIAWLHSSLLAKLLLHTHARSKNEKHMNVANNFSYRFGRLENGCTWC